MIPFEGRAALTPLRGDLVMGCKGQNQGSAIRALPCPFGAVRKEGSPRWFWRGLTGQST